MASRDREIYYDINVFENGFFMVSVTWEDIKLERCFCSFEVGVFSNELEEYIFDAIECNFTIKLKKRMLHFLSVYSQLSIMKKSKIKQNNHTPYPFLKTKQNKNPRCCMYTTSLEIGKRNSCKIMVSHKNNRVDLIRQIEIRKPNVKKKPLKNGLQLR